MKKQSYIVEIEMPDGDMISPGWLRDLIQQDCDMEENEGMQKVFVRECPIPEEELSEAAFNYENNLWESGFKFCGYSPQEVNDAFKAGAEWMAGKWETIDGEITTTSDNGWEIIRIPKKLYPLGTKVTVQIRKK